MANLVGITEDPGVAGVFGQSTNQTDQAGVGVHGASRGTGVLGESSTWHGVVGVSQSSTGGQGVYGEAFGTGVAGVGKTWIGVYGETNAAASSGAAGIWGEGKEGGDGVKGHASGQGKAGVAGFHLTNQGPGIFGKGSPAGFFEGDVHVTQKILCDQDICCTNADCAEDFDIADENSAKPGTVMVLSDDGTLHQSHKPYDKRVAGVISGAGEFKPGIVLDKRQSSRNRQPIALLGKVFCKVDAQFGAISVGDLLTTSLTPGYAMRADDPLKAFGAVIGKALRPLTDGQGLIPILIALQ